MMDKITIKKADTQATVKRVEAAPSVPSLADDIQTKEEFKYNSELELAAKKFATVIYDTFFDTRNSRSETNLRVDG
jgi:hypothetical protein